MVYRFTCNIWHYGLSISKLLKLQMETLWVIVSPCLITESISSKEEYFYSQIINVDIRVV